MESKSNIIGNIYGKWTILSQSPERKNGAIMVVAQCACGLERLVSKSLFLHGSNSEQCKDCSLLNQKKRSFCRPRVSM